MSRTNAKFRIYTPFQGPASQGFSMSMLTAENWEHLVKKTNVVRVDVDPAETQPRTHAVTLGWKFGDDDTRLEDWTVLPCADEEERVQDATDVLEEEQKPLAAKKRAHEDDNNQPELTADEKTRLSEISSDLAWLKSNRYWQNVYNSFGDGTQDLYRACNAPNVPMKIRSNWKLEADRPFTLKLYRCKPHAAQQNSWWRVRFGKWALTIRQESDIELVRYKHGRYYTDSTTEPGRGRGKWDTADGTNWTVIENQEAIIDTIRDTGRQTAEDKTKIAEWQQEISNRKARLSKEKETLTDEEKALLKEEIGSYKDKIAKRKASKSGLTVAQETEIKLLEASIIAERPPVKFSEQSDKLFNRDIYLTFIPQPRGYLLLHSGNGTDYVVVEDQDITETEADGTVIASTPIQIDSNGGACWIGFSYIKVDKSGYMESPEIFAGDASAALSSIHFDGSDGSELPATKLPGTKITTKLMADAGKNTFVSRVDFKSDGRYLPFLYRLSVDIAPTPRNQAAETLIFDSSAHPGFSWEVGANYSRENRGRAATLTMTFKPGEHPELVSLSHKQIRFMEGGKPWFTGILIGPDSVELVGGGQYKYTYQCYDRWFLMRTDRMYFETIGDDKLLGEYITQLAAGIGLSPSEIVVSGAPVTRRLPKALPGQKPLLEPEYCAARADWMQKIFDDHCYLCDMWFDGAGRLHIEPQGTVTKSVAFTSHNTGDRRYMSEVKHSYLWDDYVNDVIVYGKEIRGKKLASRHCDYASRYNPTNANYVGRWLTAQPYESASLSNPAMVNAALRWRVHQYCRPYHEISFTTDYDATLEIGDRVTCDGATVEIIELSTNERRADTMNLTVRVI